MLSQTSEHALRAILYLARRAPGEAVCADLIAAALGAPRNYLAKTLNALAKQGILGSMRGPTGGFWLRVPAEELTLVRVIEAFDEPRGRKPCLLGGGACDPGRPCDAHHRWEAVAREVWAPLRGTTIAELLGEQEAGEPAVGARADGSIPAAVAAA